MQNKKVASGGFTLLEILLVVGIIAILAGIVIVAINPARQIGAARDSERKQMVSTLNKAVNLYLIDKGFYPASSTPASGGAVLGVAVKEICNTGATSSPSGASCTGGIDLSELVPQYISSMPIDPNYASTATGTGYRIAKNTAGGIYIDTKQAQLASTTIGSSVGVTGLSPW